MCACTCTGTFIHSCTCECQMVMLNVFICHTPVFQDKVLLNSQLITLAILLASKLLGSNCFYFGLQHCVSRVFFKWVLMICTQGLMFLHKYFAHWKPSPNSGTWTFCVCCLSSLFLLLNLQELTCIDYTSHALITSALAVATSDCCFYFKVIIFLVDIYFLLYCLCSFSFLKNLRQPNGCRLRAERIAFTL